MDKPRPRRQPHVEEFLESLTPDDIKLVRFGMELARWSKTTGKGVSAIGVVGLSLLGAIVLFDQGWKTIVSWFGGGK